MKQCYTDNPKLGDLPQVEAQLAQYNAEFEALQAEMHKFQVRSKFNQIVPVWCEYLSQQDKTKLVLCTVHLLA